MWLTGWHGPKWKEVHVPSEAVRTTDPFNEVVDGRNVRVVREEAHLNRDAGTRHGRPIVALDRALGLFPHGAEDRMRTEAALLHEGPGDVNIEAGTPRLELQGEDFRCIGSGAEMEKHTQEKHIRL